MFENNYSPEQIVLDAVYNLFGGRDHLNIDVMESRVLEWGRAACADDPVIDWPIFESTCQTYIRGSK